MVVNTLLCSSPVLTPPQFDIPFTSQVDASHVDAGAVLLQADETGGEETLILIWRLQYFVYVGSGTPLLNYPFRYLRFRGGEEEQLKGLVEGIWIFAKSR